MRRIKLSFPFLYYLLFSFIVIFAYLYYRPSWGVVDDWQYIQTVNGIWEDPNILKSLFESIKSDFLGGKIRLLNCIYSVIVYKLFSSVPWLIYILNFVIQMAILPLWGLIFHKMFSKESGISQDTLFIFPLSFFIFTPFWNNFMYISVQEKMVFLFSTIAIYFFMLAYDKNKIRYTFASFTFALLCLFSKPTGVFIFPTFLVFSLFYSLFNKRKLLMPFVISIVSLTVLAAFYLLVKSVVKPGGYSSRYIENLNIEAMFNQLRQSSVVIKALLSFAAISLVSYLVMIKNKYFDTSSLILPVAFISYLGVILPWGTSNYFLGPLAPFAMGMVFPVYAGAKRRLARAKSRFIPDVVIIALTLAVFAQIIIPRIVKIAEIKQVEAEIIRLKSDKNGANFYFPPYYSETCFALSQFTDTEIIYLSEAVLNSAMLSEGSNYLIYRDECSSIRLENVKITRVIFQNNTWKIFQVVKEKNSETLNISFPQTALQRAVKLFNKR